MRALWLSCALAAGCFSPSYADCQLTCEVDPVCPDGMSCQAGFCRTGESPAGCEAAPAPVEPTCEDVHEARACGGDVVCGKKIKAGLVRARVIHADSVKVRSLDAVCVFQDGQERDFEQAGGEADLDRPILVADVVYARDLDATTIEAEEIHARHVKVEP